ncbi:hypothetical protein Nepgr_019070 [Nepenthes gracilis]|uniref:Uncharacterized protein n=1 Tax=Nepenthes gracilis TaxID=150966 RepID=A0AAD3SUR1_NEPGR|nr:hypothetical protein Nepgr_019070 [Nepenthes gracilis]
MNTKEKIEAAGKKKEEGKALFKAGKYERDSKKYEKAAKYIEYDSSFGDKEKKQAKTLKITCNLNNAACKLKLKVYKQTEKPCTKRTSWFNRAYTVSVQNRGPVHSRFSLVLINNATVNLVNQ